MQIICSLTPLELAGFYVDAKSTVISCIGPNIETTAQFLYNTPHYNRDLDI